MAALFLIKDHVRELLDMSTAIKVVEELFRELANARQEGIKGTGIKGGRNE